MVSDGGRRTKVIVEVCNAKNLMPKDGQGTASSYVMVDFNSQRRRTATVLRDLNPQWNEKLEFDLIHDDSATMFSEFLEVNIYNDKKSGKRSTFLGKVKISGSTFVKSGSESLVYYPLEKRSVFSQIKGEIGLKIWYVDEDPITPPPPPPPPSEEEKKSDAPPPPATDAATVDKVAEVKKDEEKIDANKSDDNNNNKAKEEEKTSKPEENPSPAPAAAKVDKPPPSAKSEKSKPTPTPKPNQLQQKVKPSTKQSNPVPVKHLDLGFSAGDRTGSIAYDLVDRMPFLYVRVVKAKRKTKTGSSIHAKLVIGTHSTKTKSHSDDYKDWDQVFAFDKEGLNSISLEVQLLEDEGETSKCLGSVLFDLQEMPKRVPPDSPLAPQWYSLEGEDDGENEIMLAVWFGTQADEAFQEAWQSDSGGLLPETRSKVYLSPKLWYLRLTVIQTQDLQLAKAPDHLYVKGQLGSQVFKTARTHAHPNPNWNEDLVFVAAEPFDPFLVITVEDVANGKPVGSAKIQVSSIDRRTSGDVSCKSEPRSRWFNLVSGGKDDGPYAGRIHVRACLEGGYHVLDEAAHVTSDVRPSAKQLARPPIGLLEVGIRGASNLIPVKTKDGTRGTMDAYVVAKYGPKWVRTRTILDRFNPRWNEQYTWDVYDPCTVITIGVFDNGRHANDEKLEVTAAGSTKDARIGKLRVRLSTLDTNRVYKNTYPLTILLPSGAKKMGEIEIAVRFSCKSWLNLIQTYSNPILPKMHYVRPLSPGQQDILRHTAMRIVMARLARSEPPLGQDVVQYMLDSDAHMWSMRRSKGNWFRVVGCLTRVASVARWLSQIRTWVHTPTTVLVHVLLVAITLCPHLVLPTMFMYAFLIVALRFRYRKVGLSIMDPRLSYVDIVGPDELDEEFDGFPATRSADVVQVRYDRLRALAGRAQTLLGDLASQGERMEALCNWRDPRATGIFVVFCLFASLLFYVVPFKAFVLGSGFYYLRHPRFRDDMPSVPLNFFRRLPSLSDQIL